jgi:CopG family transcriptional regulator/antitoxin EndoAI
MHRRVNITLPEETLKLIDRAAAKGDRSRLIDEAVRHFVRSRSRTKLRELLAEGARARADRDRALAEEWFAVEEEPWRRRRK